MTDQRKAELRALYNRLGDVLEQEGVFSDGDVPADAGASAGEASGGAPVVPVGTGNVRSQSTMPGAAAFTVPAPIVSRKLPLPELATQDAPPADQSPIVGMCNATTGCATLIADDNRNADGKLVCPRCTGIQKS